MSISKDPVEYLRERVDLLELSSQERKKPWYRQPSTLIAVVALIVSVMTTLYSQAASKQESIRSKKEELRRLVISLIDIRQAVLKASPLPESPEIQSASREQRVYLQAAQRLVRQIPLEVSSYEYQVLAEELASAGELSEAEDYFRRSVSASTSPFETLQSLGSLGTFYFTPGPNRDVNRARKTFEEASNVLKDQTDPHAIQMRGLHYENWAATEYQFGFVADSAARTADAKKLYEQLPKDYPFRAHILNDLDRRVRDRNTMPVPGTGSAFVIPDEVQQVLQQVTADDLREIAENDIDETTTVFIEKGNDSTHNVQQRGQYERWVKCGLGVFLSDKEVQEAAKKERTHYDYGFRPAALYPRVRDFIFLTITNTLASNSGRH
jgi:tetratricopeptide (TPR) repeat protein